ncbi:MAG: FGGY-family carbohydrate kinase [Anaerolineae bacterium]|nr:FGGY-family carbohydrate kinase [Anaerolineae bacterium]
MGAEYILAIDNGTQSVRTLVFDSQGTLIAKQRVINPPVLSPAPGIAEQDPLVYWNNVCTACQKLWHESSIDPHDIRVVTLTTQRSTVINVDKQGNPLRNAIVWLDQRHTPGLPPIKGWWGLAFKAAGASETAAYLQSEAECNWIRINQPDIWKATYKYLYLSGFLTFKLVGRFVDSVGCQVGFMPFDYRGLKWANRFDWKWQAVPMDVHILPDLIKPAGLLGQISREASEATGIPAGTPLIAAAADKACEVIGAGCLEPHIGCISYGTAATINTTHKRYVEVIPLIPPYPSPVPGYYTLEVQIYRGFWMVSWFKQEFGLLEQRMSEETGVAPEELFNSLIDTVPPGSDGLILQPYWSPGLRSPGPEARGAIIGFSDHHTRAHIYRAILEGLAYALREGADRTSQRSGVKITQLRVAGGGSQSDQAMQLTADVFGLPVARPHVYEASGLGAAIDAAVGVGIHPDFPHAVQAMTHLGDQFEPDARAHQIYDDIYHDIYLQMYPRLSPLYRRLKQITH